MPATEPAGFSGVRWSWPAEPAGLLPKGKASLARISHALRLCAVPRVTGHLRRRRLGCEFMNEDGLSEARKAGRTRDRQLLTNRIQRTENGDIGTPGWNGARKTARSNVRRLLSAFTTVPAFTRVCRAEIALLSFPEHLWDDSGAPRNSIERWIEPELTKTAGSDNRNSASEPVSNAGDNATGPGTGSRKGSNRFGGEAVSSQEPKPPQDFLKETGRHPC